jgi:hypothetical protein
VCVCVVCVCVCGVCLIVLTDLGGNIESYAVTAITLLILNENATC